MLLPISTNPATDAPATRGPESPLPDRRDSAGLRFSVATTLNDVLRAWHVVYDAYRRLDLIPVNTHHIHTNRFATSLSAAVFVGELGPQVETTLTAIHDSDAGLPLDAVYPVELHALRRTGRQLNEIGLFADRRESLGRSAGALLDLIRLAFYYTLRDEATSVVVGVHPHHAGFYKRLFGFEIAGEVRSYDAANGRPVVLLHLPMRERLAKSPRPRGLTYFLERPVPDGEFQARFRFAPLIVNASPLSAFQ
jgi:hypothetical protein